MDIPQKHEKVWIERKKEKLHNFVKKRRTVFLESNKKSWYESIFSCLILTTKTNKNLIKSD